LACSRQAQLISVNEAAYLCHCNCLDTPVSYSKKAAMKNMLKMALAGLLWINGLAIMITGGRLLGGLHYATLINSFLLPGILFFTLLGVLNIVFTFFIRRYPLQLASYALIQGVLLIAALLDQGEMFHPFRLYYPPLVIGGVLMIITAVLILVAGASETDIHQSI
jgi:hypothetical protein